MSSEPAVPVSDLDPLGVELARFLRLYRLARQQPFSHANPAVNTLRHAAELVEGLIPERLRSLGARVRWSAGQGNWAAVPWIAILGVGTDTTQDGVYPVLLFHEDLQSVDVTIAQGVTKPRRDLGRKAAVVELHRRAELFRPDLAPLQRGGFRFDNNYSLGRSPLGRDYVESTVVRRRFKADDLPQSTISPTVRRLLRAYTDLMMPRDSRSAHTLEGSEALVVYVEDPSAVQIPSPGSRGWWTWDDASEELGALRPGDLFVVASALIGKAVTARPTDWRNSFLKDVTIGRVLGPAQRTNVATVEGTRSTQPWGVQYEPVVQLTGVALGHINFSPQAVAAIRESAINGGVGVTVPVTGSPLLERYADRGAPPPTPGAVADASAAFVAAVNDSGLLIGEDDVRAFFAALMAKPFVILTGLSGSGKTQLALRLGEWLGTDAHNRPRVQVVPVRPDWTGPEYLFGYEDTLRVVEGAKVWSVPDALEFMYQAQAEPDTPYLLVLDEMNLAHVERYFADYLSGLESEYPVLPELRRSEERWMAVGNAQRLPLPRNLIVVGTVNVDETTYLFSPKVLDRAFTFEFRTTTDELDPDASKPRHIAPGAAADLAAFSGVLRDDQWHRANRPTVFAELVDELKALHAALSRSNQEFGHRVMYETMRYAAVLSASGTTELTLILDRIVLTKVLPKVHGTRAQVQPTLEALREFAGDSESPRLPRTSDKLERMWRTLMEAQFVSFTE